MRERFIKLLHLREHPDPPPGSESSLITFRASKRFLYYSALMWIPKQIAAFFGLLFSLAFFGTLDQPFIQFDGWSKVLDALAQIHIASGPWTFDATALFTVFELLAVVIFVAQLIFTGVLLKLNWELRWYMVGDECLRLREGLWKVNEQTMTISKIQNMVVRQGPIQKLFGISELEIHTAGGGGKGQDSDPASAAQDRFHTGRLRGLKDAQALRDRILARLARYRDGGLERSEGDDEPPTQHGEVSDLLAASHDLAREARALRLSLTQRSAEDPAAMTREARSD